jgi:broad specificity phosphatase PhoE
MTTRLLLIRHGAPHDDGRGRCYGSLDIGLSDLGRRQSKALAARLEHTPISVVVSSPRARAQETAAAFGCDVRLDERLRELDFGELEGRPFEEIEREQPDLYRRWMIEPTRVRFPGGEGFEDVRSRTAAAVAELVDASPGNGAIAVVTHAGVVRAALADALALPSEQVFRLDVGYCRVTVVDWFDGTPVVRMVNGGGDLPDERLAVD